MFCILHLVFTTQSRVSFHQHLLLLYPLLPPHPSFNMRGENFHLLAPVSVISFISILFILHVLNFSNTNIHVITSICHTLSLSCSFLHRYWSYFSWNVNRHKLYVLKTVSGWCRDMKRTFWNHSCLIFGECSLSKLVKMYLLPFLYLHT